MSNLNFSGGSGDNKFSDFMSGRGVYLLLAVCLVGSGIAAWSAISGSFFTEGDLPPETSSSPETQWGFPLLEDAETNDESQPLLSSQSPDSSQQQPESSEPAVSIEASEPLPEQPTSVFVLPMDGEVLTRFSEGELVKNPTLNEWRTHNGVDIKREKGTKVLAASGGKVTAVRNDPLWGFVVEIEHGNGVITVYSGLGSDIRVSRGDEVSTRDVIGTIGDVPAESHLAPHLHFEVKVNREYVEPFSALRKS